MQIRTFTNATRKIGKHVCFTLERRLYGTRNDGTFLTNGIHKHLTIKRERIGLVIDNLPLRFPRKFPFLCYLALLPN